MKNIDYKKIIPKYKDSLYKKQNNDDISPKNYNISKQRNYFASSEEKTHSRTNLQSLK